jgi:acyl dehydratase
LIAPFDGATAAAGRMTMKGLYYEEFKIGMTFEHALTRTVTEMDNVLFTALTHNPQPLHLDHHFAAANSEFKKPLVNSIFTLGLVIGVSVGDTTLGTTVGNLGMSDTKFPKPVFYGDTIRSTTEIVGMRESKSRPDVGIVDFLHRGYNQRGEIVCECKRQGMMKKKPKA